MLILRRRLDQKFKIGENITITIVEIGSEGVRIGIDAPKDIPIVRDDAVNQEPRQHGGQNL